jgi:hypothetical protein
MCYVELSLEKCKKRTRYTFLLYQRERQPSEVLHRKLVCDRSAVSLSIECDRDT